MFLTHYPTQPTKKLKNLDPTQPSPTQPNPWVDPTHGHLCAHCRLQTWRYPRCMALRLQKPLVKMLCERFSHTTVHTKEDLGAPQQKNKKYMRSSGDNYFD